MHRPLREGGAALASHQQSVCCMQMLGGHKGAMAMAMAGGNTAVVRRPAAAPGTKAVKSNWSQRPRIIVGSQFAQVLDFFDVETFERVGRIENVLAQPHEMVFDPARRLVYLTHTYRAGAYGEAQPKGHEVSVIDVDAQQIVDMIDIAPFIAPHDIDFDRRRDLIYTGVEAKDGRNGVVIIDAKTRTVVGNIAVNAPNAHWMGMTGDGSTACLTHKDAPVISIIDLIARKQVGELPSPGGAEEIDCSPDGRWAFAATPMMSLIINVAQAR